MEEGIILGIIQGITEWLPISSEGALILVEVNFFKNQSGLANLISYVLFLHLGTFFAALIYFRKDVFLLLKGLFNYQKADKETRKTLNFLILTTIISGLLGFLIFELIEGMEDNIVSGGKGITLLIGIMLLVTAFLQFQRKGRGKKEIVDLKTSDGILLGIFQGASVIPGLSRSGLTVSALLLRKFNESQALKLSFLMSLPAILAGNIALNLNNFSFSLEFLLGFSFSFLFGILTIHLLLKIANRLNFAWFVLFFALITIISLFI